MIAHDYLYVQDEMKQAKSLVVVGRLLIKDKDKLTKMINYQDLAEHTTALAEEIFLNFKDKDEKYYCAKELNHLLS